MLESRGRPHHEDTEDTKKTRTEEILLRLCRLCILCVFVVESSPLYRIAGRVPLPIAVTVEEDSIGGFKRIRYGGRWYGAEAPVGVQIAFAVVALGLAVGSVWWAVVRIRRRRRGERDTYGYRAT